MYWKLGFHRLDEDEKWQEEKSNMWGPRSNFSLWFAQKIEKRGENKLNYNTTPTKILNNDKVF